MTALNKQALRVPERKRHDWSQAVMRDCDFCSQWALTVKHDDSGHICASCCDAEYTSELKCALETAIDRAEAAEKRIAEQNETLMAARSYVKSHAAGDGHAFGVLQAIDRSAGIGVKGE
ncbi:hypothetical protein RZP94_07540 [Citrobacter freundii]|uniref:hypothetical protein n=1 Tax=Citrobacter freundii TaxID=546 RepID=UPI00196A4ED5|nr:hypothetical protein [Citrobacter freundii]MDH0400935.1 hypothetical protein [Citrobacter freundii]MDV1141428.1 hypothetical protein [Citrobacter freundii]MDV1161657.1 hypothetical protein [Citrobacter freundii]MDV1167226.1 hypothetical protein [Citrobacter freundii]MEB0446927.1 hypothetical protein [Citrobacter freundii]